MKRFNWIWIVLLTFVIGLAIATIWVKFHFQSYSFEEVATSGVPKTKYCDLVNNPFKYDGEIVRVNTSLHWFTHGFYLADVNCTGEGDSAKTAITFNETFREKHPDYLEKYRTREPVEIIAVGVFKYKFKTGGSDGIEDRTRLHFEIYGIDYSSR